jgi:soluble lytic murein transglycosylase-like protein
MTQRQLLFLLLGLAALAAAGTGVVIAMTDWKKRAADSGYLAALNAAEDANGIPRDLLVRLAYQESRFRPDIINGPPNSAGAQGLMQIVPAYHPGVDPSDPFASIAYAGQFLRSLYNQFGSWSLALAAYNTGPGNVKKYGGIPPFTETQNYVAQIIGDINAAGGAVA